MYFSINLGWDDLVGGWQYGIILDSEGEEADIRVLFVCLTELAN